MPLFIIKAEEIFPLFFLIFPLPVAAGLVQFLSVACWYDSKGCKTPNSQAFSY